MVFSEEQVEYLSDQLQSRAVTYKTAARDLSLHVNEAKLLLHQYYEANRDTLTASFLASGTKLGSRIIKLIKDELLLDQALKESFDQVDSVHVYCFTLSKFSLSSSEIAIEELAHPVDLSKLEEYYKHGLIKGRELKSGVSVTHRAPPADVKPEKKAPAKAEPQTNKAESKPEKPASKIQYQSRKEQPKTPLLSNYVSRKGEKQNAAATEKNGNNEKRKAPESKPYQYKSRKLEKSEPKERVVMSSVDNEGEAQEEEEPEKPAPTMKTTDLNALFVDDMSDFSDDNSQEEKEEPIAVEGEKEQEELPKEASPEPVKQTIPENSVLRSLSKTPEESEDPQQPEEKPEESKPETTVDEDGYIVTRKPAAANPPKSSKPASSNRSTNLGSTSQNKTNKKPDKKSTGKMKQTSLMNFFGK